MLCRYVYGPDEQETCGSSIEPCSISQVGMMQSLATVWPILTNW